MVESIQEQKSGRWAARRRGLLIVVLAVVLTLLVWASITTSLPDNEIRVVSFEPAGITGIKSNITIRFSKPMVSRDSLDQPVLDPPLQISPPIPGLARWVETDVLRFFPDAQLLPATEYVAKVASDKTWACGFKIVNKEEYRFQSPPNYPSVDRIETLVAPDPDHAGMVRMQLELRFNYAVNAEELQRSTTIKGGKDAGQSEIGFSLTTPAQLAELSSVEATRAGSAGAFSDRFILTTDYIKLLKGEQHYTLIIAKGLSCRQCSLPLADQFVKSFRVEPRPTLVVNSCSPQMSADKGAVWIYFSTPVSAEDADKFISVDPKRDFYLEEDWESLVLRGDFEPTETVTLTIAKGLKAKSGASLESDFSTKVTFPDRRPEVAFTSRSVFLPRKGNGLLEFKTVNVSKVAVEVEQVFPNNLVHFLTSGYGNDNWRSVGDLGRSFWIKDRKLESERNQWLTTTVDLKSIIGDTAHGVFKISVRDKEERWLADSRWAMVTDIGVMARLSDDYLMVWANSLSTAAPVGGATVSLLSRNNQTLVEGRTDSRGIAVFEHIKDKLAGFEPFVIQVTKDHDMAYLRLDETILPITDFDVAGRPYLASGYEAFLYGDRGVYRPGDTVHMVSIVRGPNATTPSPFPYFLTVYDNRGRKFTSFRMTTERTAVSAQDFVIPDYAATGKYSVNAEIGDQLKIGQFDFLVEEFMPDQIKVQLAPSASCFRTGELITADVKAKYLFGTPASSHRLSCHITIEQLPFEPQGWSQYSFTNPNLQFPKMERDLHDTLLNDSGCGMYTYEIPRSLVAPSALKGLLSATVYEQGGRGISAYSEVQIHPYPRYVGLRLGIDGYAKAGQPVEAQLIGVDPNGKAVSIDRCHIRFNRIVYNTVLKRDQGGMYRYVSERKTQLLDSSTIAITAAGSGVSFTPQDYGCFEIVASDALGGHSSAQTFYASGWGYAPWALSNPDKVELQFDKKCYAVGDKAILQVRSPFGGKLMLTVEKDKVLETITRDLTGNTAEIELPVAKQYFPNAYVSVEVIRTADSLEVNMPARAFGIVPLRLSTDDKKLPITITAPDIIKPRSKVTVAVQVGKPRTTELTIVAVDAGILQLTDYATPDPMEYFYGKKQPLLKPYDLYSFLYPRVARAQSHVSAGGDAMFAAGRKRHINPVVSMRVRSVVLWSGLVKTDPTGLANVTFDIPEFNGKLVWMAVAVQGEQFGSASRDMTVRDKIILQESFPRFVSPNDQFDGLITVFNNTGNRATIDLSATAVGPVEFVSPAATTVTLDDNAQGTVIFKLRAKPYPEKVSFTIQAQANSDQSRLSIELPNRPALPLVTLHGSGAVTKGTPASFTFPAGWLPGTDQYVLKTSGLPSTALAKNIQYLLSYPYGCVEQTTSRIFPLLYFNDIVKVVEPSLMGGKAPDYFISEGVLKLGSMVLPDGSFSFWPGAQRSNNWSTIYASHCLSEASRAGFYVDKKFLDQVYDHLDDMAQGKNVRDLTDAHRIYAAYVLAQAGKLQQKVVSYLKKIDPAVLQPYSRYQLAGALAMSGNNAEAMRLVPVDVQPSIFDPESGGDFNSGVKTDAILLDVLMLVVPNNPAIDVLAKSLLERAEADRWYTTQDNAFALMAIGKYFKRQSAFGYTANASIEGDKTYSFDSTGFGLTRKDLAGRKVSLSLTGGSGACFYYWQASGVPSANAVAEFDHGMKVRREYFDEDARPIDPKNVKLGARVICAITAETVSNDLRYVVINDLLPAGFEIENPRIKTTPRLSWIPSQTAGIDFQDIRDDRLLIFTDLHPGEKVKYYYSLRAICAGDFKIPPISGECMYNPLIASCASSGTLTVTR